VIRIQRATAATLSRVFYEDAAPTNPGVVTVTVTASDGTKILDEAATSGTGTAARTVALTADQTAQLDTWTVEWTSPTKGTVTDEYEIVGGHIFALNELAAIKVGQSDTIGSKYSVAQMASVRVLVEQALEDACGVAFVPRYRVDTVRARGSVMLERPRVLALRSISVNGFPVDPSLYAFDPSGAVHGNFGRSLVTVGYEHGWAYAPARVSNAALLLARRWLIDGPVDDRATSMSVEGVGTYALVTPGMRGAIFDLPECNQVVQQYSMVALVA
jgi:hypothetical protein